jgi:hypothetical protein
MNIPLKLAILKTVRTQIRLASITAIPVNRISLIVNQWVQPTPYERRRIADAVGEPESELFKAPSVGDVKTLARAGDIRGEQPPPDAAA